MHKPRVNTHGPTQIALFLLIQGAAQRYDTQVEVLFNGTANVTRRQALRQLHKVFTGRDQRRLRLLD